MTVKSDAQGAVLRKTRLHCPQCHGGAVARSRPRNLVDRLGKEMGFVPYRCLDCWHRFRTLSWFG